MNNEPPADKRPDPPPKLCLNCAYRGTCRKRFNVQVVNGQVRCLEYARDVSLDRERGRDDQS